MYLKNHEKSSSMDENILSGSLGSLDISRKIIEHDAFVQIRKSSVDPYNRLHSIDEDSVFVRVVYAHYHDESREYPLLGS